MFGIKKEVKTKNKENITKVHFGNKRTRGLRQLSLDVLELVDTEEDNNVKIGALCLALGTFIATDKITLGTVTQSISNSVEMYRKPKI